MDGVWDGELVEAERLDVPRMRVEKADVEMQMGLMVGMVGRRRVETKGLVKTVEPNGTCMPLGLKLMNGRSTKVCECMLVWWVKVALMIMLQGWLDWTTMLVGDKLLVAGGRIARRIRGTRRKRMTETYIQVA